MTITTGNKDYFKLNPPRSWQPVTETCFYCGKPVDPPSILWSGYTADIHLHSKCANDLIIRLARDIHEFQCKGK